MEKQLKEIVQANGREIYSQPDDLMDKLSQAGCPVGEIMALGLLLKGCPPVMAALLGESITESESNTLISAAVAQTGLGVATVRRLLAMLARCAGVKTVWTPKLLLRDTAPQTQSLIPDEAAALAQLEAALQEPEVSSEVIHDLDVMSQEGSIRASYLLGEYFRTAKDENSDDALQYYQRAARQGYGPANGAIASYMLKAEQKNMVKIAALFEHPTATAGHYGRKWSGLYTQLLRYRAENAVRIKHVSGLQILTLAITLLLMISGVVGFGFLSIVSLLAQILSLGYLLYAKIFGPYFSCKVPCLAMMAGWLLLALTLL